MSGIEIGALCVVGAFLLFAAVRLFRGPVKLALRVLVNSALGFGAVWLLNLTAALTGIRLGLNVFNALFIGVLGVPGFGLLLRLHWVRAWQSARLLHITCKIETETVGQCSCCSRFQP